MTVFNDTILNKPGVPEQHSKNLIIIKIKRDSRPIIIILVSVYLEWIAY